MPLTHSRSDWHSALISITLYLLFSTPVATSPRRRAEIYPDGAHSFDMFNLTFLLGFPSIILFSLNKYLLGINFPQLLREHSEPKRPLDAIREASTHQSPVRNRRRSQKGLGSQAGAQHPHLRLLDHRPLFITAIPFSFF